MTEILLIKGGTILNPASGKEEKGDILIQDGKIVKIGKNIEIPTEEGAEVKTTNYDLKVKTQLGVTEIDAKGLIVAPGLIDIHCHFRDPGQTHKEDILTGAASGAKGGYTTVICMANTVPPVDSPEVIDDIYERAKEACINVLQTSTVTKGMKGEELVDMELMANHGAVGFTDDGRPLMDEELLRSALRKAKELALPISLHEEDPKYVGTPGVNRGKVSELMGLEGASAEAEVLMVERDARIALEEGGRLDFQHLSAAGAVPALGRARTLGADVWGEATPHHFSLTEDAVAAAGTLAKMNPPLRTEADRMAIIQGLRDGTIQVIATDHAPHTLEEKGIPSNCDLTEKYQKTSCDTTHDEKKPHSDLMQRAPKTFADPQAFTKAPSGIIGLETALALGITNLVDPGHLTLMELIEKMTVNPAALYNLDKGTIEEGKDADIVIFDPKEKWTVTEDFASKSKNSPFVGIELTGKIKYTVCNGKIAYSEKNS